jgi:hypothetical protein
MQPHLPDYHDGSLVNLIASIVAARGGKPSHKALALLAPAAIESARNIVLFLVDGLGHNYLADVGRGGALHDHLLGHLTSVFPSTTASAITTSFTGLTPAQHGLTGWHCWFPEADVLAAPLPFRRRGDERPLGDLGIDPTRLFDAAPIMDALDARPIVVTQSRIVDSEYSRHFGRRAERRGYDGLLGLVDHVEAAVRSGTDRKYVYAYYPDFDAVSHQHGVGSVQAANRLRAIDAAFAELLKRLSGTDTTIIVAADHGFIDTKRHEALQMENFPELAQLLRLPLSGEPRVAFCHVQPGAAESFIERARALLGEHADVRPSHTLIAEGWFGPGSPHPRLADRVGDVALVMRGHSTIKDHMPDEKRHVLIGNHGGTSEDEMLIPLVLARL